jgi:hypothetical protein
MTRRELLFSSAESQVYRWSDWAHRGPVIVKATTRIRLQNLIQSHRIVEQLANIDSPMLVQTRFVNQFGVALFPDMGLQSVKWSPSFAINAIILLATLHRCKFPIGDTGNSHTPDVSTIVNKVRERTLADWQHRLTALGLTSKQLQVFGDVWHLGEGLWHRLTRYRKVWSHGDAHYGNFLWHPTEKKLFVIDWEFAHFDLPQFDLYQLIDATSPTHPLIRPTGRTDLVRAYWSHAELAVPFAVFFCDYLEYAIWHDLWIMSLIESDLKTGKHSSNALHRQLQETLQGVSEMLHEWRQAIKEYPLQ